MPTAGPRHRRQAASRDTPNDLDYIWKQVDRGPAKDAASYYIQAGESGGEPPGRWWGPCAKALGLEPGQRIERMPYDLPFGERKSP